MKPALEHLPREKDHSFVVKDFNYHYFPTPWHYHPEYEIVLVTESLGKRLIGDHVSRFDKGNLAFLGPNIPHTYRNDDKYYEEGSRLRARSIVIHFTEESLGKDFLALPETALLLNLFERASLGMDIFEQANKVISRKLHDIVELSGLKRWICLVDILLELATARTVAPITKATHIGYNEKESKRMCNVLEWITTNFENDIKLADAAKIAEMNENAFSRYFSKRTRKTFTDFIQELRLQKAARLLIENDMTVTEICYDCGYNNVSNFNRQFLNHYHVNPMNYKKEFTMKN